jgi:hypothetical protein
MNKIFFRESQQFRQWWYIVLILAVTVPVMIMSVYSLYMQIVKGVQVGDNPAPNAVLVGVFFAMGIVLWGAFSQKLETWIDQEGIHYRFFPIIFRKKLIAKAEIQRYELRKYNAILDYGGWGIRRGFGRKWGKAYNVSGNIGLQLYFTNGKKLLIGTQRSQAILYAMDEMMKRKL